MKPLCFFGLLFFPQRIPLVPRISVSPENVTIKPKLRAFLKGKTDPSLEGLESNFEVDEKIVMDTWQQASLTISHMVSSTCSCLSCLLLYYLSGMIGNMIQVQHLYDNHSHIEIIIIKGISRGFFSERNRKLRDNSQQVFKIMKELRQYLDSF